MSLPCNLYAEGLADELSMKPAARTISVLVLLTLVGFAPTFFLRPLFAQSTSHLSWLLVVHGLLGILGFGLIWRQSQLARNGNLESHRRNGIGGSILMGAIAVSSILVTVAYMHRVPARLHAAGPGAEPTDFELWRTGINITGVPAFIALFAAGILYRKRPEHHRRYMLWCAYLLAGPAIARIAHWMGPIPGPLLWLSLLPAIPLIVMDLRKFRLLHAATVVSLVVVIVSGALVRLPLFRIWLQHLAT